MFEKIFTKIQEKNDLIKVIGIWGKDGLELERVNFNDETNSDLDMTGAQIADIMSKINELSFDHDKSYFNLEKGELSIFILSLTSDYFIIVLYEKGLILGKLIFYLKLYWQDLITSL
ncbi:MAG: hypothetical protein ABFR75_00400 [Acidobacteriota bacterium]